MEETLHNYMYITTIILHAYMCMAALVLLVYVDV